MRNEAASYGLVARVPLEMLYWKLCLQTRSGEAEPLGLHCKAEPCNEISSGLDFYR